MKKFSYKILAFVLSLVTVLSVLNLTGFSLQAGNFIYVISGTDAKITGLSDTSVSGKLEIPSTLGGYNTATIGAYAFSDCDKLTSITVPASVKTLETHAFADCNNLQTVSIASGVTSIGVAAFFDCDKLQTITVDSANSDFSSDNGILFNKNKTELICFPEGKSADSYSVPSTVTKISDYAFYDTSLESVTVPASVKVLGIGAFSESNTESVAFASGLETISERAFYNCSDLKAVTLPSSVKTIGDYAFFGCEEITSVNLPKNLVNLSSSAFNNCPDLSEITADKDGNFVCVDGVVYNANKTTLYIYPNAKSDTSFTVPSSVTSISENAFAYSLNLKNITLHKTLKTVKAFAFMNCANLEKVTFLNSDTAIGENILFGSSKSSVECYKNATAYKYAVDNSVKYTLMTTPTTVQITVDAIRWPVGKSSTFAPVVSPAGTSVTWSSSNNTVATVSSTGKLTAVGVGTATITCKAADGSGAYDTCTVTVYSKSTSVQITVDAIRWPVGKSSTFAPVVSPAGTSVTWSSSNNKVATVSSTG
ncbi:MAG: leucine-rich repeat protein, partial [Clostridia bacterium]|nr:leucine-rich repeat protein [Clostridia bacterium]